MWQQLSVVATVLHYSLPPVAKPPAMPRLNSSEVLINHNYYITRNSNFIDKNGKGDQLLKCADILYQHYNMTVLHKYVRPDIYISRRQFRLAANAICSRKNFHLFAQSSNMTFSLKSEISFLNTCFILWQRQLFPCMCDSRSAWVIVNNSLEVGDWIVTASIFTHKSVLHLVKNDAM